MTDGKVIDLNALIENQRLGRFQLGLAALLILCMFVDGFEAQAPGFAAPAIIEDWKIPRAAMGLVFGATNLGVMLGAFVLGFLGDRTGRKLAIVAGCFVLVLFSILTVYATDVATLRLLRLGSGIGVGGVLPSVVALGTEYSPKKHQAKIVWFLYIGYQAGASSGALVSTLLIPEYGWQAMFVVGALLPLGAAALVLAWLPESVRFLSLDNATLPRVLSIAKKIEPELSLSGDSRLVIDEERKPGLQFSHLFADGRAAFTLALWFVYAANLMALQFLVTWLPTVLESPSVSRETAATVSVLVQGGGIIGGLILGRLLDKGNIMPIAAAFALAVPMVALIGSAGGSTALLILATFGTGCTVLGGQTNLNAMSGRFYPTFIRSNGVGWANGVGRIGSVLGPVIGGMLIGLDLPVSELFLFAAIPPFCAAIGCFVIARLQPQHARSADLATESIR